MLLVSGKARIPAKDLDRLRTAAQDMVNASRAEEGCIEYAYAFDMFDRTLMRITERWVDREVLERHFATEHMKKWRAVLATIDVQDLELFTLEGEAGRLPV